MQNSVLLLMSDKSQVFIEGCLVIQELVLET